MTTVRATPPRRIRLGGWPVAVVTAAPLTALLLAAAPATGLGADVIPTTGSTATATATATPPATETVSPTDTSTTVVPTTEPASTSTATPSELAATAPAPSPSTSSEPTSTSPTDVSSLLSALDPQGLHGGATALATLGDPGAEPDYLAPGVSAGDLAPFQTLRLVVQLRNDGRDAETVAPTLEFRADPTGEFRAVPEVAAPGVPIHGSPEWLVIDGGTATAPETVTIPVDELRLPSDELVPAPGRRSSGVNPVEAYAVGPGTVTEQEFTFALSIDAAYGTTYEVRVSNGGDPIAGLASATVTVGAAPATVVSPGQRDGSDVDTGAEPTPTKATATGTTGAAYLLVGPETTPSDTAYPLQTASATADASPDDVLVATVGPNGPGTIHDPGRSTTSGQCSACHQTHTARSQALSAAPTETGLCYSCHAGGTGGADVKAQYTLGQPANDPATRSYWSHDTTDPGDHVLDSRNEFEGRLTRHSQCSDCHDPHGARIAKPLMTPTGWTAPGGVTKVSGVAVTNGPAGTVPTYTWLDGMVQPVTAEYQLCFKCHTSFTTLPEDVPGKPSQGVTDLAMDFNPANPSYHPIEAPGRNQTQKLADSLAGPSAYKLWNFTTGDTVRCVSCHASNTTGTSSDPAENAPDATLTVHASTNRGILIRPYENRVLSAAGQFYDATGAALCLTCHTDTPFMNRYRPAAATGTNFVFHGLHMSGISSKGNGGLDIDAPGAGQGNARCAECHFSSHGTTQLPDGQQVTGDRLVGFSPNVLPSKAIGGVPTFTKTATGGTCTLTCHGKDHQGARYTADTP